MDSREFVSPKDCSRCKGRGYGGWGYADGRCARCGGSGKIEGDRDALAAERTRQAASRARSSRIAQQVEFGKAARGVAGAAAGLAALVAAEPARAERAFEAWLAGDARVLPALAAYEAPTNC